MALLSTPPAEIGMTAPDFELPGCDNKIYTLEQCAGENGLLVIFMCNHCPYVQRQLRQIVDTAELLEKIGVNTVAISSNDIQDYPEDSPEDMLHLAQNWGFTFPYLYDETQAVAKAYGAVCTPDFFGFDKELDLFYRGRLDDGEHAQELFLAFEDMVRDGKTNRPQNPSMGCSIKWKD
ncbi:MAG: thioredoxin family protein [Rickettsiales bacterium]|nr:thioredoxin family protein [Rickettsiales bacterium]|tara:strand:+ start:22 stop:555 length:534 start_codon:yes stop_codon:yes gene_type:complete